MIESSFNLTKIYITVFTFFKNILNKHFKMNSFPYFMFHLLLIYIETFE